MSGPVERWLETFMCKQYANKFEQFGYKTLQSVCQLQPAHLHAMQIAPDHCEKILENVSVLRQTMHAGGVNESDQPDSGHMSGDSGSMNQYNAGSMYSHNPHMIGNGYSQHPSIMGSHMHSMHQPYMSSYQGQIQGHVMQHTQAYPQYPQPIMSTHQGYGTSYSIPPPYPESGNTYPPTSGSVPMHHHMRGNFSTQNPQDVADSIFHMTASYGPSRSSKYPLEPLPPSMPSHLMPSGNSLGQMSGQRYPYPSASPMYQANSVSPMPIRSPASVHSNQSVHSHASSPAQGPSPHGMYPPVTAQSPGIRSPSHQTLRSPVHGMNNPSHIRMSPMHSSPAQPSIINQPSPVLSQTHMNSPNHTGHYSPIAQQSSLTPAVNQYTCISTGGSSVNQTGHAIQSVPSIGEASHHDPIQSLQKLVMLPESRVIDPKSVVHDANLGVMDEDMGLIDQTIAPPYEEKINCVENNEPLTNDISAEPNQGKQVQSEVKVNSNADMISNDGDNALNVSDTCDNTEKNFLSDSCVQETSDASLAHVSLSEPAQEPVSDVQNVNSDSSPKILGMNSSENNNNQGSVDSLPKKESPMCPPKKRGRKSNSAKKVENSQTSEEGNKTINEKSTSKRKILPSEKDEISGFESNPLKPGNDIPIKSRKSPHKKGKDVDAVVKDGDSKDRDIHSRHKQLKNGGSNKSKDQPSGALLNEKKKAAEKEYEYHGSDEESDAKSSPTRFSHSINNILKHSKLSDSDSSNASPIKRRRVEGSSAVSDEHKLVVDKNPATPSKRKQKQDGSLNSSKKKNSKLDKIPASTSLHETDDLWLKKQDGSLNSSKKKKPRLEKSPVSSPLHVVEDLGPKKQEGSLSSTKKKKSKLEKSPVFSPMHVVEDLGPKKQEGSLSSTKKKKPKLEKSPVSSPVHEPQDLGPKKVFPSTVETNTSANDIFSEPTPVRRKRKRKDRVISSAVKETSKSESEIIVQQNLASEESPLKTIKEGNSSDEIKPEQEPGNDTSMISDVSLPSTSTPIVTPGEKVKKKRGRPVGSKNRVKTNDSQESEVKNKKKRGRKPQREAFETSDNESLITSHLKKTKDLMKSNKKKKVVEEKVKGPLIHIQGSKDNPDSCVIINDADGASEKVNKGDKRTKSRTTFLTDATKAAMHKSAAIPSSKPSASEWVCALCGRGTSYKCLGDLFGPYYLSSMKSSTPMSPHSRPFQKASSESPPKKKGRKKRKADTTVVPEKESKRLRRPSMKRSMSADGLAPESEIWLHEDCLVWCQGVYLIGNRLYGLEEALADAKQSSCSCCRSNGAFIGCFSKGCGMKYHFLCARDRDCHMDEENLTLLCPKHKDKKAKLN